MNTTISHTSMIRGADGRLYAVSAQGINEVAESAGMRRAPQRAGDIAGYDAADHEAGRMSITPGT
ncbi:hypothetical protein [Azospirillum sp. SYSU D00513]|uniref:hypothetical protein n=1 Tax=Azospirillum sp. SYSU D00513 TaxID=2812561 RepID=UPI001A9746D4|nr:hypothetical protein [Azospirillum sp. SYSU D00513]